MSDGSKPGALSGRRRGKVKKPLSETPTTISEHAKRVYIAPDTIGLWRLRKSLAAHDARWYFDRGRKEAASICIAGARDAHRQIVRILRHLRAANRLADLNLAKRGYRE